MATYSSDNINSGYPDIFKSGDLAEWTTHFRFTLSNTNLTTNDIIRLQAVPRGAGALLLDYLIEVPVIDTGTALVWSLGDDTGSNTTAYISGTTAGRTATGPAVCTPQGISWNTTAGVAPTFVLGAARQAVPKQYASTSAGNTTTGGNLTSYLIMTISTGPGTSVSTGIKITGFFRWQNYGIAPLL